jgi:hypothetical protein
MPFAAVGDEYEYEHDGPPPLHREGAARGRQSEVMSRGAGNGLKSLYQGLAKLGSSKTEYGGSPEGNTFGQENRTHRKAAVRYFLHNCQQIADKPD